MLLELGLSSVDGMLCMQIVMLLILERAISQIHAQLKQKSIAAPGAAAVTAKVHAPPGGRPTIDSLGPEVINPDFAANKEWAMLKPDELQVVRRIKTWLGNTAFSKLPRDLLVCFVRGYAYRADWAEASYAYLDQCLRWRDGMSADVIALQSELLPPKREMFESIVQAGPIGFDREGHPVIVDRVGATDPGRLLPNFDQDAFMRQQCYNRECLRAYATANCLRREKRLYKVVQVVDLKGLGWAHTDSRMYALLKHYNSVFGWNYPESISRIIVINAPFVFQAVWKVGVVKVAVLVEPELAPAASSDCMRRFGAALSALVSRHAAPRMPARGRGPDFEAAPSAHRCRWLAASVPRFCRKMIQPWIHPITRQKIDIQGGSYQAAFAKNGITLFDGATEARHASPRHTTHATNRCAALGAARLPPLCPAATGLPPPAHADARGASRVDGRDEKGAGAV